MTKRAVMLPDYRRDNPYQELLARGLEEHGWQVTFPAGYRRGLPLFRALRGVPGAEVLHLHWTSPYIRSRGTIGAWIYSLKLVVDLLLVRLSGKRIVWTLHNLAPHEGGESLRERWLRRTICRLSSTVIVHGEAGRGEAQRRFGCPAEKIAVIPHGHYRNVYPPAIDAQAARERLGLRSEGRLLLFFGMIRPYKGVELLLRAWRRLNPASAQLLIAGKFLDDAYAERIRAAAAGLPGVTLADRFVPDDEVPVYFSAADAVVLPFERVQTSGSLILAMSFGKPVITSPLGELPEVLAGADDLVLEAIDEEHLAQRIEQALTMDLTDLARRTAAACDTLDWDTIGAATAAVYGPAQGSVKESADAVATHA